MSAIRDKITYLRLSQHVFWYPIKAEIKGGGQMEGQCVQVT